MMADDFGTTSQLDGDKHCIKDQDLDDSDDNENAGSEVAEEVEETETQNDEDKSKKLSKRAQRRQKRMEMWAKKKAEKKEAKKERQRQKREANGSPEESLEKKRQRSGSQEGEGMTAGERKKRRDAEFQETLKNGLQIIIDCGFESEMTEKEIKSLVQQIMYCYGVNRRASRPARMHITSLHGRTEQGLNKINGFPNWKDKGVVSTIQHYNELFPQEDLVYLTADSENEVTELDPKKAYIIGGIVDRNRLKGATMNKALRENITTAKLPLDKHLMIESATRVLTVNHVYEIMLHWMEKKNWKDAFLTALPPRKNAQPKSLIEGKAADEDAPSPAEEDVLLEGSGGGV